MAFALNHATMSSLESFVATRLQSRRWSAIDLAQARLGSSRGCTQSAPDVAMVILSLAHTISRAEPPAPPCFDALLAL